MTQTNYQLTHTTMAILPVSDEVYRAKILDSEQGEIYVKEKPLTIIENGCLEGGATYTGRRQAMVKQLGFNQKSPIPILPHLNLFAFPTVSPTQFSCIWVFPKHIKSKKTHGKHVQVAFHNNEKLILPISTYTLIRQVNRTSHCMTRFSPWVHDLLVRM